MGFLPDFVTTPKFIASSDAEYLYDVFVTSGAPVWILKPPAESRGQGVFLLRKGDKNIRSIIQTLTGYKDRRFCIMQEYVEVIEKSGEKRILIANGEIIGHYTRQPQDNDHRTNLSQGARPVQSELTQAEHDYCLKIAAYLKEEGMRFVGLDMVFPYILEINVVNPGGLETLLKLTGNDLSAKVIEAVIR